MSDRIAQRSEAVDLNGRALFRDSISHSMLTEVSGLTYRLRIRHRQQVWISSSLRVIVKLYSAAVGCSRSL